MISTLLKLAKSKANLCRSCPTGTVILDYLLIILQNLVSTSTSFFSSLELNILSPGSCRTAIRAVAIEFKKPDAAMSPR